MEKSDFQRKIEARVAATFEEIIPQPKTKAGQELLKRIQALVEAVWFSKVYSALPKDKTTIPEYFLDAELEQLLNEAVEECYQTVCAIAERTLQNFRS